MSMPIITTSPNPISMSQAVTDLLESIACLLYTSIPDPAQDTEGQRRTAENAGPLPRRTRPEDDRKNALSHRTEAGTGGCSGEEFEKEGYIDQPRRVWHSPGGNFS